MFPLNNLGDVRNDVTFIEQLPIWRIFLISSLEGIFNKSLGDIKKQTDTRHSREAEFQYGLAEKNAIADCF